MTIFIKSFTDLSKFVLWADAEEGKRARLVFSFRDGNPRLTVYTGIPGKEGVISFPSDIPTMVYLLTIIKDIANAEPNAKQTINSMTNVYVDNKATAEKKVLSTLYIGKSKDGIVYLSLISEDKPKIIFTIKPSIYHVIKDKDGNAVNESVISSKMAIGIADFLLNIVSNVMLEYTKEEYSTTRKPTPIKESVTNNAVPGTAELDEITL
ncbi:MAG: hypothetical protein ACD_33C00026G0003 [uncultured bacterium]|nr:MAG: hypothetical protein ACD_33C00026G0003 [uncultured bacterium]